MHLLVVVQQKASKGTLTMMLSGEEDAIAVLRPYLQVFCENLYVVGNTPGDAQKVKLLNQLLVGIHMQATAEAFTVAKKHWRRFKDGI